MARRFDRIITIQEKAETPSDTGDPVVTWSMVAQRRRAQVVPTRGEEGFSSPQIVAGAELDFIVRYSESVADIGPLHRIVYPAVDDEEEDVEASRIYDVLSVQELGRRDLLRITARCRPDVSHLVHVQDVPDILLLESGDAVLLESGDNILLEAA